MGGAGGGVGEAGGEGGEGGVIGPWGAAGAPGPFFFAIEYQIMPITMTTTIIQKRVIVLKFLITNF